MSAKDSFLALYEGSACVRNSLHFRLNVNPLLADHSGRLIGPEKAYHPVENDSSAITILHSIYLEIGNHLIMIAYSKIQVLSDPRLIRLCSDREQ